MKKGTKLKPWTVKEELKLIELAGKHSSKYIAAALGRSEEAIVQKVKSLKAKGAPISLRHYDIIIREICPSCGKKRGLFSRKTGMCRACEITSLIEKTDREIAICMTKLPSHIREVYLKTESQLGSSAPPRPTHPKLEGLSPYQRERAKDIYESKMEDWEINFLTRVLRAKRRRFERMKKKLENQ